MNRRNAFKTIGTLALGLYGVSSIADIEPYNPRLVITNDKRCGKETEYFYVKQEYYELFLEKLNEYNEMAKKENHRLSTFKPFKGDHRGIEFNVFMGDYNETI